MLVDWVKETAELCVSLIRFIGDGSEEEYNKTLPRPVDAGVFKKLNPAKKPNSYIAFFNPSDVARWKTELIFALEEKKMQVPQTIGFTLKIKKTMTKLYDGCMKGRTMYDSIQHGSFRIRHCAYRCRIIRFCLCSSKHENMTRMGKKKVLDILGDKPFVKALHLVGAPLAPGQKDSTWPCNKENTSPFSRRKRTIWSYGSGYGGNALLGKKCFALHCFYYGS